MSEEKTFTLEEVQELLRKMGVTEELPKSAGDRIASVISETITEPDERAAMMKAAAQGAEAVSRIRKQKQQAGLRSAYEKERDELAAKYGRGSNALIELKRRYAKLGLEIY